MKFKFIHADQIDREKLKKFWERCYGPRKADFLAKYGSWWYRNLHNSLAIINDDRVVAYYAVIPIRCAVSGKPNDAVWWVDLIVAPEFRGKGIQHIIDEKVKAKHELVLGIPNKLAAKIHVKHGWGVKDDGLVMMLPIRPIGVRNALRSNDFFSRLLKLALTISDPLSRLVKLWTLSYSTTSTFIPKHCNSETMVEIFKKSINERTFTTWRDAKFLKWRYLNSPFSFEYKIFFAGHYETPTHYLVSRTFMKNGVMTTRILDIVGDFRKKQIIKDLVKTAVKYSVKKGACQVIAMAWNPQLISILRTVGFLLTIKTRFCWFSKNAELMRLLSQNEPYLTLGDSDNDEPI